MASAWIWDWGMPAPVETEVAEGARHLVCEPTETVAIDRVVEIVGDVINRQKEATDVFFALASRSPKFVREYQARQLEGVVR